MVQQLFQFLKTILYFKHVSGNAPIVGVSAQIFFRGAGELRISQVKPICCRAEIPVFGNGSIISIITQTYNEY
jgi:hypothetical protein